MLTVDLVTPEKVVSSEEVTMAVIPGSEGEFGVLEAHSNLISTLCPGVISLYEKDTISGQIFVTGGFAEVTGDRCTILATDAFDLDKFSKSEAKALLSVTKDKLAASISEPEKEAFEEEIKNIEKLVELCK